jgi:hypothetical protein
MVRVPQSWLRHIRQENGEDPPSLIFQLDPKASPRDQKTVKKRRGDYEAKI